MGQRGQGRHRRRRRRRDGRPGGDGRRDRRPGRRRRHHRRHVVTGRRAHRRQVRLGPRPRRPPRHHLRGAGGAAAGNVAFNPAERAAVDLGTELPLALAQEGVDSYAPGGDGVFEPHKPVIDTVGGMGGSRLGEMGANRFWRIDFSGPLTTDAPASFNLRSTGGAPSGPSPLSPPSSPLRVDDGLARFPGSSMIDPNGNLPRNPGGRVILPSGVDID